MKMVVLQFCGFGQEANEMKHFAKTNLVARNYSHLKRICFCFILTPLSFLLLNSFNISLIKDISATTTNTLLHNTRQTVSSSRRLYIPVPYFILTRLMPGKLGSCCSSVFPRVPPEWRRRYQLYTARDPTYVVVIQNHQEENDDLFAILPNSFFSAIV